MKGFTGESGVANLNVTYVLCADSFGLAGALSRRTYFRASSLLSVRFLKRYSKTKRASENIARQSSSDSPVQTGAQRPIKLV